MSNSMMEEMGPEVERNESRLWVQRLWSLGVLVTCCLSLALSIGSIMSMSVMVVEFLHYFRESKFVTSWANSIAIALTFMTGLLWMAALRIKAITHRRLMLAGIFACTTGLFTSAFATTIYHLHISLGVLTGLGSGAMTYTSLIYTSEYFTNFRFLAIGLVASGSGIGSMVIPILLNSLLSIYSWRGTLTTMSTILLQFSVFTYFLSPIVQPQKSLNQAKDEVTKPTRIISKQTSHKKPSNEVNGEERAENKMHSPCTIQPSNDKISSLGSRTRSFKKNPTQSIFSIDVPDSPHIFANGEHNENGHVEDKATSRSSIKSYANKSPASTSTIGSIDKTPEISVVPIETPESAKTSKKNEFDQEEPRNQIITRNDNLRYLLHNWRLYAVAIARFLTVLVASVFFTFNMDYFLSVGIPRSDCMILVMCLGIGNVSGRVLGGIIAQCMTRGRSVLQLTASSVLAISFITTAFFSNFMLYAVLSIAIGVAHGFGIVGSSTVLLELFEMSRYREAQAMLFVTNGMGALIGAPIGGLVFDLTRDYPSVFVVCTGISLFATAVFVPIVGEPLLKTIRTCCLHWRSYDISK